MLMGGILAVESWFSRFECGGRHAVELITASFPKEKLNYLVSYCLCINFI